jgi:pimeloyl-ACP methyl ester carboxylesterase
MNKYIEESIYIEKQNYRLHLKRMYTDNKSPVIFMLHGSIENGKIFYSKSGKGLAPFLAQNGFDVFVADLRGRGYSTPQISKESYFGQYETINEDIPDFIKKIIELKGETKQHWIGHSWGGVLLASFFSRFPEYRYLTKSMIFFGTKRVISVLNPEKILKINLVWNLWSKILIKKHGYLPAKNMKFGSDDETKLSYEETDFWVRGNKWIDPRDNFNYIDNIKDFPPLLSLTGKKDRSLGHPIDVENFIKEINPNNYMFKVLGKKTGFKNDYDHINILTHSDSNNDHFKMLLDWLNKYNN